MRTLSASGGERRESIKRSSVGNVPAGTGAAVVVRTRHSNQCVFEWRLSCTWARRGRRSYDVRVGWRHCCARLRVGRSSAGRPLSVSVTLARPLHQCSADSPVSFSWLVRKLLALWPSASDIHRRRSVCLEYCFPEFSILLFFRLRDSLRFAYTNSHTRGTEPLSDYSFASPNPLSFPFSHPLPVPRLDGPGDRSRESPPVNVAVSGRFVGPMFRKYSSVVRYPLTVVSCTPRLGRRRSNQTRLI